MARFVFSPGLSCKAILRFNITANLFPGCYPLNTNSPYETLKNKFTNCKPVLSECVQCEIDGCKPY